MPAPLLIIPGVHPWKELFSIVNHKIQSSLSLSGCSASFPVPDAVLLFRLGLCLPGWQGSPVLPVPLCCRFAVMACCWALDPEERPKFQQLVQCLTEFHAALGAYVWNSSRRWNSLLGRSHGIHLQLHASLGLAHVMCIKQHYREKALLPKHCALECLSSLKFFCKTSWCWIFSRYHFC